MFTLVYTENALDDLHRLDKPIARRILDKMDFFAQQKDPHAFAKHLTDRNGEFRFRIGDYRASAEIALSSHRIVVLRVKHRREMYDY